MFSKTLPESLRYLLAAGQQDKALALLKKIAATNRSEMPAGTFVPSAAVIIWLLSVIGVVENKFIPKCFVLRTLLLFHLLNNDWVFSFV